jgi:hypothetical protein
MNQASGAADMQRMVGTAVIILLLATLLALVVSFGLLRLYRRRVLRAMNARTQPRAVGDASATAPDRPAQASQEAPVLDRGIAATAGASAEDSYSETLHGPWRTAAVYAVAGLSYALVSSTAMFVIWVARGDSFYPLMFLAFTWAYAWPIVLTVNLVAAVTRRAKLATAAVYFLVPVLVLGNLAAIGVARGLTAVWSYLLEASLGFASLWLIYNSVPTALLVIFLSRRIRAVGPLVEAFMLFAVAGPLIVIYIGGSQDTLSASQALSWGAPRWAIEGYARGFEGFYLIIALAIFARAIALGLAVAAPLGWLTVRWIRGRYERKKLSDQSITLDAVWLLFVPVQSLLLYAADYDARMLLPGLLAFAAYKATTWAGFRLLRRRASAKRSSRLLLLRVFSLGRRSERLFDAVATHWRHLGDIRLIAGPDLATSTVEPHEFLDFLSGRLARRFIDGPETLEVRLREADPEPDRDGRFRVNDFFCHDDTWRTVLSRLVEDSDAVLMDLRGFSQQNAGAAYEVGELIDTVPLHRVVFVVDGTTDEEFMRRTVREAWGDMRANSPNRYSAPEELITFRLTGSRGGDLRGLLRVLCDAAGRPPRQTQETNRRALDGA